MQYPTENDPILAHLAKRRGPKPLRELQPTRTSPWLWAIPAKELPKGSRRRIELASKAAGGDPVRSAQAAKAVGAWLRCSRVGTVDLAVAVEANAWCHALPRLAGAIPSKSWWTAWNRLLDMVIECAGVDGADPVVGQLLAGELALSMVYLYPEIRPVRRLLSLARRTLTAGLTHVTHGVGVFSARHLPRMAMLLACWTRSRILGGQLPGGCWGKPGERVFRLTVREALRWVRDDGTQVLSANADAWNRELLAAAVGLLDGRDERRIAQELRMLRGGRRLSAAALRRLPAAASHCEMAATAVLRCDWQRESPQVTVACADRTVNLEIRSGGEVLSSGEWEVRLTADGHRLEPKSRWHEVCWLSDSDVDYLEVEMDFAHGIRVQRHIVLPRKDRFLWLADAVLGRHSCTIEYSGILQLAAGIRPKAAIESRECFVAGRRRQALVLPVALPEWRCEASSGELLTAARFLELRMSAKGRNLFAPLFFDLDRRRIARPFTWRRLTVGENRRVVPCDSAVGYRVQTGRAQWLFYRSLVAAGNRTVLGHNLSTEMLVGRFTKEGLIESLVETEGTALGVAVPAHEPHLREQHIGTLPAGGEE